MNPGYVLASLSSVLWGSADFLGGVAAKRAPSPLVTCFSGIGGLATVLLGIFFLHGSPSPSDLAWGALAGVCGALGASLMYRALALGPMSLASPVFSLIGLCVPVLFGLAAGERPGLVSWIGVLLAMFAIPLLSMTGEGEGHHPREHVRRTLGVSIAAGLVIGWFLVCLARIGHGAGLWPLVAARISGTGALATWFLLRGQALVLPPASRLPAIGAGAVDSAANIAYLLAVQRAPLVLVAALVSLAPAATALLARFTLSERWTLAQAAGLALALVAGLCISVG